MKELALVLLLLLGGHAQAAQGAKPIPCAKVEGGAGRVVALEGPLALKLEDGRIVRLSELGLPASLNAPSAEHNDPAGRDLSASDASAEADALALAALRRLVIGREVRLYHDGAKEDRRGRKLAQVHIAGAEEPPDQVRGGLWLQRALVSEGAALVDSWSTNRACALALLAAEAEARVAARGLWSDPANRILSIDEAQTAEGRFAILEGRVIDAAKLANPARAYLNFGADWRTDFTVRLEPAAVRLFTRAGLDPLALKGRLVRVRGHVGWRAGPEIEATHPEVIEVLEEGQSAIGSRYE